MRYDLGDAMKLHIPAIALFAFIAPAVLSAAGAPCEDLAKLELPATTISAAQAVPAGPFTPPGGPAIPNACVLPRRGVIKPSDDSNIQFEVWMPSSGWNGKFQGVGNGGYAGSISYGGMAAAVRTATPPPRPIPAITPARRMRAGPRPSGKDDRFRLSRDSRNRRQS